jgi:DNA repair protein RecO (recombination protein O)
MLHHTRGIIFHQVKFSETSLIVKIYTEQFGLQTYILRGIRSKKSLVKPALLQPLTLVEMEVSHKEKNDIQHVKEIKVAYPFKSIPFDIRKSSVIMFLTEILNNVIREQESNSTLFEYIYEALVSFDTIEEGIADFHLYFMMELTKHLGFYPKNNYKDENTVFDLQEGIFVNQTVSTDNFILKPYNGYFARLIGAEGNSIKINSLHRSNLLEYMIRYYKVHIPGIKEIKSHHILQTILND